MSIERWINTLVEHERLYVLRPLLPGQPVERRVYATREVNDLLCGPWRHQDAERRCGRLRADFDAFVAGEEIGICTTPYKAKHARMGLLGPVSDGVWDFRSQSPKPGIRVLGKFALQDTFLALIPAARSKACDYIDRGPLLDGDSPEWKAIIRDTNSLWRGLMPMWPAITGDAASDYFRSRYYQI